MSDNLHLTEHLSPSRSMTVLTGWRRLFRKFCMKCYRLTCRMACVRCLRPQVAWGEGRRCPLGEVYSFFDESSADVIARHARVRPCPPSRSGVPMSYSVECRRDRYSFTGNGVPRSWIYLSSNERFPEVYAIEFEYTPHAVFREFLQVTFAGDDLDNRHRFVVRDNACLEYEMFWHGLFAKPVGRIPLSLGLHRTSTIRVEVVGDTFSFIVDGVEVLTVRDRLWRLRPTVGKLIFWNDAEPIRMTFELGGFRFFAVPEVAR